MIINRSSWHYRIASMSTGAPPDNLCSYVRQLVLSVVFLSVSAAFALVVLVGMLVAPLVAIDFWVHDFGWVDTSDSNSWLMMLFGIGATAYFLAAIVGGVIGYATLREKLDERADRILGEPREPSVVRAWINDMHEKTCTLVEYK